MGVLLKSLLVLLTLTIAAFLLAEVFETEFGQVDFWSNHGFFFLIFIALFPRLTLLFSNVAFGGVFWWLGFFFCPRILVACLATVAYFKTNPFLVVVAWMLAISGETAEKITINRKVFVYTGPVKYKDNSSIEADYKQLS